MNGTLTPAPRIAVIDAGIGNLRSVQKALEHEGARTVATSDPDAVRTADAVVLPGVGAFGDGMAGLRSRGLDRTVQAVIERGTPFFGICVGLQLLFESSEEMGEHTGLGILPGRLVRFPTTLTVPHMGWNQVDQQRPHPMLAGVPDHAFAYFAHSYIVVNAETDLIVATTDYGLPFPSALARDNVWAIQFHPEKSQQVGLTILRNFVEQIRDRISGD